MTSEVDRAEPAPKRLRIAIFACLTLAVCAMGTAWGYQAFFSGMQSEEQAAVTALKHLAMVVVEYDDNGSVIELRANSSAMNDEAALHLTTLQSLQRLILNQSGVTDDSLAIIGALPNLKSLYLERTAVTSAGVAELAAAKQLEQLILRECAVDDTALAAIGSLKNLSLLDLSKTKITDAGMQQLKPLTKLKTLYLQATEVSGNGFANLATSPDLELIDLSHCVIDHRMIETLESFPALDRLYLGNSALTDELVSELIETLVRYNPKLRGLAIPNVPLTDAAVDPLKRLSQLPDLAVVDLQDTMITKAAFLELAKSTPEINYAVDYPVDE